MIAAQSTGFIDDIVSVASPFDGLVNLACFTDFDGSGCFKAPCFIKYSIIC